nr:hypothetical protein [Tanacetum cinerariifolium]
PGRGGKKNNNKQGNGLPGFVMDHASFPPLLEHMPSSSSGVFWVEQLLLQRLLGMTVVLNGSAIKNGSEQVGNVVPSLYATKLRPTFSTMANLWKLEANVTNDANYDVWLPLDSVLGVNDKMKNSLYQYFIGKRLAFPVVGWNWTSERNYCGISVKPPHCSTCLISCHSLDDCSKAPKRVVNKMDKGKGGSSRGYDEGFVKVKKKKSSSNNGGNKNFKHVSVKPEHYYRPKAKQSTKESNQKTTPYEVETGNKAFTSGVQEECQSSKSLVENINMFEKQLLDGECVLVDNDGKPLKKVDHSGQDSGDETESIDNEMASHLASKPSRVGYDIKSLLEQWRETYVNNDHDSYDDDMYE